MRWRVVLEARLDLATARFIGQREDALFLGPPGTGKSDLAQAIGRAAIQQGYRVTYREADTLLEEIADATLDGTRKALIADLTTVPLLIIDDLGMRELPHTAAEDLLELIMRWIARDQGDRVTPRVCRWNRKEQAAVLLAAGLHQIAKRRYGCWSHEAKRRADGMIRAIASIFPDLKNPLSPQHE